jgi:hypothetical protein
MATADELIEQINRTKTWADQQKNDFKMKATQHGDRGANMLTAAIAYEAISNTLSQLLAALDQS